MIGLRRMTRKKHFPSKMGNMVSSTNAMKRVGPPISINISIPTEILKLESKIDKISGVTNYGYGLIFEKKGGERL